MKRTIAAVAVLLVAGWSLADEALSKKYVALFQGEWNVVSVEKDGKADAKYKGAVRTHTGDTYSMKLTEGEPIAGTYKLDPSKTPLQIDSTPASGQFKGKVLPGIYKLDGDTLTICFDGTGKDRPTDFAASGTNVLAIYKKK